MTPEDQVRIYKQNVDDHEISDRVRLESEADQSSQLYADKTIKNFNNNETSDPPLNSTTSIAKPDEPCLEASAAATRITNDEFGEGGSTCYNKVLDDEIRSRLDNLNALSSKINSLERQFDFANCKFNQTLKWSASRLSSIAKSVGTKSIRQSRLYHTAKVSVEQSQSDCQLACVKFEQANKDHHEAESKLKEMTANGEENCVITNFNAKLTIHDSVDQRERSEKEKGEEQREKKVSCDTNYAYSSSINSPGKLQTFILEAQNAQVTKNDDGRNEEKPTSTNNNAAKLSEELNQAITNLIEAERKRGQSERLHLDQANKLMVAQENLTRLEREYGPVIRRTQLYFDEAKRFKAKLSSIKGDICRISEDILRAKQAYADTLKDLEKFSDDLHESTETGLVN